MKAVILILAILLIYLFIFALCKIAGVADQNIEEMIAKKYKEEE